MISIFIASQVNYLVVIGLMLSLGDPLWIRSGVVNFIRVLDVMSIVEGDVIYSRNSVLYNDFYKMQQKKSCMQ